jgi:hypothetical protein
MNLFTAPGAMPDPDPDAKGVLVEPVDFDSIEPPKINVRGLSPARASLAQHVAWRKLLSDELDKLFAGRRDLADYIGPLEKEQAKASAGAQSSVNSVVDRIKSGLKWKIVPSAPAVNHSQELEIAWSALAKIDADRATLEALVTSIDRRIGYAIDNALFEYGAPALRDEYKRNVEALHATLVKISSLHRVRGFRGTDVLELPKFDDYVPPRTIGTSAVDDAIKVWLSAANAWRTDPRAEPKLTFPTYDAYKRDPARVEDTGPSAALMPTCINPASLNCHED